MRLIDADALLDALDKSAIYGWSLQEDAAARRWAERAVELTPTVEAECGEWEVVDESEPMRYGCNRCKCLSWHMSNFCPNCGAKMKGADDED